MSLPKFNTQIADENGFFVRIWQEFLRSVSNVVDYVGDEKSFPLLNNNATPTNITGLKFDKGYSSCVFVEYLIQRVTLSTESNESGIFWIQYNPKADSWTLLNGPSTAGITLTVTASGAVQYVSTSISGTQKLSRIVFRKRELAAKAYYSKVG